MGLRPEFENVRSSIQFHCLHQTLREQLLMWDPRRLDLLWVLGVDLLLLRVLQIRFLRLQDIEPMVRIIFNLEALLVHQANETCPRSYATLARSRVTWLQTLASGRMQTLVDSQTQLILLLLPQRRLLNRRLPNSIGPLLHYFYDLKSTPTPDTTPFRGWIRLVISLPPLWQVFAPYNIGGCSSGAMG